MMDVDVLIKYELDVFHCWRFGQLQTCTVNIERHTKGNVRWVVYDYRTWLEQMQTKQIQVSICELFTKKVSLFINED